MGSNASSGEAERSIVEIDVGQCVGSCDMNDNLHCILWSGGQPATCLMSLVKRRSVCTGTSYQTHHVTSRSARVRAITAVTTCGCQ